MSSNMLISRKILEILKVRKMTQEELAKGIKKSKTTINNWTSGRNKVDASSLKQIADYFQVPISYFFGERERADSEKIIGDRNAIINTNATLEGENAILREKIVWLKKEVEQCKARIKDKEEMIKILKERANRE